MRVIGEVEERKGGWWTECRAVCQNDTLQRAALQSRLALNTFHLPLQSVETTLRRRGQRLRRTNYSTTILRPSAPRFSYHSLPALFLSRSLSLSLSPFPLLTLPAYNPSSRTLAVPRTYNLHHHTQPIQRLTFSLHRLTLLLSSFLSSLTLRLDSLFLARPPLYHLQPYVSLSFFLSSPLFLSLFFFASLHALLPTIHPLTLVLTSIASRSLTLTPSFSSGLLSSNPRIDFTLLIA